MSHLNAVVKSGKKNSVCKQSAANEKNPGGVRCRLGGKNEPFGEK